MEHSQNQEEQPDHELVESRENHEHIIDMHEDAEHGQNKCPRCGATEISLNIEAGKLQCHYCRYEFEHVYPTGIEDDLYQLNEVRLGAGAQDIDEAAESIVTLKCQSCGAEVVVSTDEAPQARCHWCRNTLSLNHAVPNGAVPDVLLPFALTKQKAEALVTEFVKDRWFFAHSSFKSEFTSENIFGVYLPYMIVDAHCSVTLQGEGEVLVRKYKVTYGSGENAREKTRYDADAYFISREFDMVVNDLTVESSADKLDHADSSNTKNVINTIMPFDTENVLRWNANYIKGFHSEKRDVNVTQLRSLIYDQLGEIACEISRDTILEYDRGVRWEHVIPEVRGEQWISACLPVWLYSYQRGESGGKLFYTAVNARTGETMGSVPINYFKLTLISLLLWGLSCLGIVMVTSDVESLPLSVVVLCYPFYIYGRYTNQKERHWYEGETDAEKSQVQSRDEFIEHRKELEESRIEDMTHMPRDRD